jgi:hypothetical protein
MLAPVGQPDPAMARELMKAASTCAKPRSRPQGQGKKKRIGKDADTRARTVAVRNSG